jgi:hypothetical protein
VPSENPSSHAISLLVHRKGDRGRVCPNAALAGDLPLAPGEDAHVGDGRIISVRHDEAPTVGVEVLEEGPAADCSPPLSSRGATRATSSAGLSLLDQGGGDGPPQTSSVTLRVSSHGV